MKLVAASLALAATGCSLFLTDRPKLPPSRPSCTPSMLWPVADGGVAVISILGLTLAAINEDKETDPVKKENYGAQAGGWMIGGIVFAVSSVIGMRRVSACKRAHLAAEQPQLPPPQPYPGQYGPPPPYPPPQYPPPQYPPAPYPPQPGQPQQPPPPGQPQPQPGQLQPTP